MKRIRTFHQRQSRVAGLIVIVIALQTLLGALSMDVLSSVRAFVGGESIWSKAQRDAAAHLNEYQRTRSETEHSAFVADIAIPLADRRAREEMDKPAYDEEVVGHALIAGGVDSADVGGMIRLYRRWHASPLMSDSVSAWVEADDGIAQLDALMKQVYQGGPDDALANRYPIAQRARALDAQLTVLERRFSERLGKASRDAQALLLLVNAILAAGLAALVITFSLWTFRKQRTIEGALRDSHERWELAAHGAHLAVVDAHVDGRQFDIGALSRAISSVHWPEAGPLADGVGGVLDPEDGDRISSAIAQAATGGLPIRMRCRVGMADGTTRHLELLAGVHAADANDSLRVMGILRDVSDDVRGEIAIASQTLRQGLVARFGQMALENPDIDKLMTEAVAVVRQGLDVGLCRLFVTGELEGTLRMAAGAGWRDTWMGNHVYDAVEEAHDQFVMGACESMVIADFRVESRFPFSVALREHGVKSGVAVLVCGAEGPFGVLGAYDSEPNRFSDDSTHFLKSIAHALAAAADRRCAEEKLARMAQFDYLTGLPNRSLYMERLLRTTFEARRGGGTFGVLFIDIDRFKSINDTYGHGTGDLLLAQVAERLLESVRQIDMVSRLGGDEFAVTLGSLAKADDAAHVAKKIVAALAGPFLIEGRELAVSASIGISIWPTDGNDPDTLLRNADTAMYRAKEFGRNTYQFYLPQMNERVAQRALIETQLRLALERGEFLLHYQPKVSLASGTVSGFEALLRWQHPERGLVAPAEFIGILEETGLIVAVGEWVIADVCRQLCAWETAGIALLPVAINLSGKQFRHKELDTALERVLATSGVNPCLLEFELTESVLMADSQATVRTLQSMRALGVRVSVDDFGTGYSSLAYLKRFPLDTLKIDRSFINDLTTDPGDSTIVRAIINLAKGLGLTVVAEGVETVHQVEFLRQHACDEVQGFYFSRPMPAETWTLALAGDRKLLLPGARQNEGGNAIAAILPMEGSSDSALAIEAQKS